MIAPTVVEEIRRLLRRGKWSQRSIARQLGVSRGTVNAVLQGKRSDGQARPRERDDLAIPLASPERCPGCGGKVQMPCLLCQARWLRETQRFRDAHSRQG